MMHSIRTAQAQDLRLLARTGWLALQPPDFQDRISAIGRWITVPGGRALYMIGDEPDAVFGLGAGYLELSIPVDAERDVPIYRAPPGFWVGDAALLARFPRQATVVAVTECELFRVPEAPLRRMLSENPGDWQYFYQLMTINCRLAMQVVAETLALPSPQRLARALLRLERSDGIISATQEELGRMVGMSRAAFRRAFGALIAAGVLETGRGRVRIHDRAALLHAAGLND